MYKLVLLRHGESQWNLENRFTGWTDVPLSVNGLIEAQSAGQLLKKDGFSFNHVYTSFLKRSIQTTKLCLNEINQKKITIEKDWRLNERHYGNLQGLNKSETAKKYGKDKVLLWRRSYDTPPPPLSFDDKRHPRFDDLYSKIDPLNLPNSESLKDTINRLMPLWHNKISKNIKLGKNILIVAHGNSLRALVKYLDNISNKTILELNIPTGVPLVYELDKMLIPILHYYLGDKKAIKHKTAEIAAEGNIT